MTAFTPQAPFDPSSEPDLSHIVEPLRPLAIEVSALHHDLANVRQHNERNLEAICYSLKRFRQRKPLVVQLPDMIVRAGNGTLMAAKRLGWTHIAAVVVKETNIDAAAFAIADNRTAELATWDERGLSMQLKALANDGVSLEGLGFDDKALEGLGWGDAGGDVSVLEDGVGVEAEADVETVRGDVWVCGRHRVMCGDATSDQDVTTLFDGEQPGLMVTDPPYGVHYDARWREEQWKGARSTGVVLNDDEASWSCAWALSGVDVAYVWHAATLGHVVRADLEAAGYVVRAQLIWAKPHFAISRGHYHWQHEPCWYAVRKGKTAQWAGDRSQSTLWQVGQSVLLINNSNNEGDTPTPHSTQKPVECMARPIRNHAHPLVYDPFLGSGTTLIAAEQLDRVCYAMEIHPPYVEMAVRRWERLTGQEATRVRRGEGS